MSLEEEMQAALDLLLVEAAELLEDMEAGLLGLEDAGADQEVVNSVFRAVHTIKGSAGLFGLSGVVAFTHVVESVLDRVRADELAVSPALVSALLPCKDHIASLLAEVAATGGESDEHRPHGDTLLAGLTPFLDAAAAAPPIDRDDDGHDDVADRPAGERMHLSLRFGADSLRSGMDPLSFLRYLTTMGEVVAVTTLEDLLPEADAMDAETCYLAFQVTFEATVPRGAVEDVFEFVRDESDVRILTAATSAAEARDLVESFGDLGTQVDALVRGSGLGFLLDEDDYVADVLPDAVVAPAQHPAAPTGRSEKVYQEARTIRVDAERLDRLIDTVGELVISGAGAGLSAAAHGDDSVRVAVDEVIRLIEGVRDDALRLRMVPIGTIFGRFQRVVRDVSADLGKDVALQVSGGDTEVDKALVEQIADPLMHLVRNALDHGIEATQARLTAGKPARGTLHLRAEHDSGSIVVEIEDDGGGIDPERVLAKAVERGLVDPGARLSVQEVHALLFEPGFSTAGEVSALSGRGVGMDVVKRNVTALRGTIDVESTPGQGTTVRIRLPLTLAIIDGFMVGVGSSTFIVPLDRVLECVELPAAGRTRDYIDLRGQVLPLIRLRSMLAVPGDPPRRESVVVVEHAGSRAGLVVDTLMGEFQTVIKPLGPMFSHVEGIGGSTILGNGDVALIIDVPLLVRHADRQDSRTLVGA